MADLSRIKVGDLVRIRQRIGEPYTLRVVRLTKTRIVLDGDRRFRRDGTRPQDDGFGAHWQVIDGIVEE